MSTGIAAPDFTTSNSQKVIPMFSPDYAAADEGSYFVASCPTVVNTGTTDTLEKAGTNPNLVIQNQHPAGDGFNIYLRYIKLKVVVVQTNGGAANYGMWLSTNNAKLTTPATAITPYNVNGSSPTTSRAYMSFGANTTIAPASDTKGWLIGGAAFSQAVIVVLDVYTFAFGEPQASTAFTVATVGARTIVAPPVIIAPQHFFVFGTWATGYTTAASNFAWEVGFVERPAGQ